MSWIDLSEIFEFMLWGKNVFDKVYWVYMFNFGVLGMMLYYVLFVSYGVML